MGYLDFFAQRGLSEDQARACLADVAKLQADADLTQKYSSEFKVDATPTFVLNGQRVEVSTWDGLEPVLQRAGAR
jgi:protein-disulfide isomerase